MNKLILLLLTIVCVSKPIIPPLKKTVIFDEQITLEQINACLSKRRPVECVKKLPIPSNAPVLQGLSLLKVSWIIIATKDNPYRLAILEAFAKKTGSLREWYKRMHDEPIPELKDGALNLLCTTIAMGDAAFVDFILKNGIHPDEQAVNGNSALKEAAIFDKQEIAAKLLAKGANPNLKDNDGKTPLSHSISAAMAQLLKDAGAIE